jgi:hypothetical protein
MQGRPLLIVEVVPPVREHLVQRHELDHFPFGQIRGLIEDEAPVVDVGFERLHRLEVYVSLPSLATPSSSRASTTEFTA